MYIYLHTHVAVLYIFDNNVLNVSKNCSFCLPRGSCTCTLYRKWILKCVDSYYRAFLILPGLTPQVRHPLPHFKVYVHVQLYTTHKKRKIKFKNVGVTGKLFLFEKKNISSLKITRFQRKRSNGCKKVFIPFSYHLLDAVRF